jgi:hypothetical protein
MTNPNRFRSLASSGSPRPSPRQHHPASSSFPCRFGHLQNKLELVKLQICRNSLNFLSSTNPLPYFFPSLGVKTFFASYTASPPWFESVSVVLSSSSSAESFEERSTSSAVVVSYISYKLCLFEWLDVTCSPESDCEAIWNRILTF